MIEIRVKLKDDIFSKEKHIVVNEEEFKTFRKLRMDDECIIKNSFNILLSRLLDEWGCFNNSPKKREITIRRNK